MQGLSARIQEPKLAHTSERKLEPKYLAQRKGFEGLHTYNGGTSSQWEEWCSGVMDSISQACPRIATLAIKVEKLEADPDEPTEHEARARVGTDEITADEWCSEQMWAIIVRKTKGQAKSMTISLTNLAKSGVVRAWYKLVREAKSGVTTQVHEVTERFYPTTRKQVSATDVVPAIEEFDI